MTILQEVTELLHGASARKAKTASEIFERAKRLNERGSHDVARKAFAGDDGWQYCTGKAFPVDATDAEIARIKTARKARMLAGAR